MIIDAHTHIGFGGAITASAKELLESMDKANIDKALVFAGAINECTTADLLQEIKPHRDRLIPIGTVSPKVNFARGYDEDRAYRFIDHALDDESIAGLKFYTGYEHFYPGDAFLRDPYLNWLQRHNKVAIFHSGDCYNKIPGALLKYAQPLHIDDLAVAMPDLKIVIAHMGDPWQIDAAEVCYKNKNVYADISGFVYGKFDAGKVEHFRRVVSAFRDVCPDPTKLLFGSDWPISDQADYVRVARDIDIFGAVNIAFAENAKRVFELK